MLERNHTWNQTTGILPVEMRVRMAMGLCVAQLGMELGVSGTPAYGWPGSRSPPLAQASASCPGLGPRSGFSPCSYLQLTPHCLLDPGVGVREEAVHLPVTLLLLLSLYFLKTLFFKNSVRLKLEQEAERSPCPPPAPEHFLLHCQHPHQRGTFVTTNELTLTYHYRSECVAV